MLRATGNLAILSYKKEDYKNRFYSYMWLAFFKKRKNLFSNPSVAICAFCKVFGKTLF
jgi:hypothetical protein